uniref:Uncharacterized protein n=1 Tax=Arundo donax TaxID=35708 RepID=A0A0A9APC0_ARUDO
MAAVSAGGVAERQVPKTRTSATPRPPRSPSPEFGVSSEEMERRRRRGAGGGGGGIN